MSKVGTPVEKPTKAINLALTGGVLIIFNAVLLGVVAKWFIGIMPKLPGSSGNDPTLLIELAAIGLIFGVLLLLGAFMLRIRPGKKKVWGIMIIVFSLPSVIMGGGFIIGFILGIIGGAKAFNASPKHSSKVTPPSALSDAIL